MGKKRQHRKEWRLTGTTNRHHNLARCRGGTFIESNIFNWDISTHQAYHFIFGVMTLQEASNWLLYVYQQKRSGIELDINSGNVQGGHN